MQLIDQVLELKSQEKLNREIGAELGLSETRVCNLLRIAKHAQPNWLLWVTQRKLTLKHLEAVLMLPADKADDLLRTAMVQKWTAARLREEVRISRGGRPADARHDDADVAYLEEQLTELLATRVRITTENGGGGELRIRYTDLETLEGVLERMGWRAA